MKTGAWLVSIRVHVGAYECEDLNSLFDRVVNSERSRC